MNCGKDLSSTMYGMKRIGEDVFIFVTYHKEESADMEKSYVDGKPDYADAFEDNVIFRWDSQIGRGVDSSYMQDVCTATRKHLLVKKSDAETNFYYHVYLLSYPQKQIFTSNSHLPRSPHQLKHQIPDIATL